MPFGGEVGWGNLLRSPGGHSEGSSPLASSILPPDHV